MSRYLTGIQSSGVPHLGNLLGAIMPAIRLSQEPGNEGYFFIADLHSLTTVKDAQTRRHNTLSVAAAWLAFGFDTQKNVFYRQSMVTEVCELAWYLNCLTPFPMLANAHSFKDKKEKLADVNAGLFTYPVLMAADILLYDAEFVPVGKDQVQHLEMTRDIAVKFNHEYGETFVVPEVKVDEQVMIVPGIDGQKMSKSYNNFINLFLSDKELLKVVKSIVTDSLPLESPKNPEACNVFRLYELVAERDQVADMRQKYLNGGFGYGHAKQALYEVLITRFKDERDTFTRLMNDPGELEQQLKSGEDKARAYASIVLGKVREKLGFR
jgi:tryptophanyl-tRNA synthetase